jgi:hypothetical protein
MKKLFLMLAIAGFLTSSYAQTLTVNDVPAAVTKTFNKTHPKVDTVQWSKTGDDYTACYDVKEKDVFVTYNAAGKLKETAAEISVAALPTEVLKYINENYPRDYVKSSSKVTSSKGKVTYAVRIKGTDLIFNSNGKIIT